MSQPEYIVNKVLYIMSCGSSSGMLVEDLVRLAQAAMWKVCVITTPEGTKFIDIPKLEQLTGYSVRSHYKRPEEPDVLPRADAIVVFPATFNTIYKWASGISDTLVVGTLCEYMGLGMPILVIPCFRTGGGLDGHPIFFKSLEFLQACGVHVIYEPEKYPPKNRVPGDVILEALSAIMAKDTENQPASFASNSSRKGKRKNERYYLHKTLPENHAWTDEVCLSVGNVHEPLGKMMIRWYRVDDEPLSLPRIEVDGDKARTLFLLPEVVALLDRLGNHIRPYDLCELLHEHFGFTDARSLREYSASSR